MIDRNRLLNIKDRIDSFNIYNNSNIKNITYKKLDGGKTVEFNLIDKDILVTAKDKLASAISKCGDISDFEISYYLFNELKYKVDNYIYNCRGLYFVLTNVTISYDFENDKISLMISIGFEI